MDLKGKSILVLGACQNWSAAAIELNKIGSNVTASDIKDRSKY